MVKGWQKNCIILQKSTHSKAYFFSPSILYAHFGKENINGMQKKRSLSASLPIRQSVFVHTHTNRSYLLFCVRLVLLPLSYKLVHQCKHQPCTTNGDKIDCQKSKCLSHVLQRRARTILATLLLSYLLSISRIINMISHKKYSLINLLV